jgi:YidC/Oxa1 family membrane protein insertase
MGAFFHTILYQPIFNALVFLYEILPVRDFGIAIILLTIIIRFALLPLSVSALRSQTALREIQPQIKAIQDRVKKEKKNPQEATQEIMALYRAHGINPFQGFLPILVQLPILFALYRALFSTLAHRGATFTADLYPFVSPPTNFSLESFGGAVNLTSPSLLLAVFAGIAQFIQSHLAFRQSPQGKGGKGDFAAAMSFQMRFFFPIFTIFIVRLLPAGIAIYWIVTTMVSILQQLLLQKKPKARDAVTVP